MAEKEQAAGQGAMSGAAAGSVAGPWGAAIGGVAGGIMGYMSASASEKSDKKKAEMLQAAADSFRNIPDPQTKAVVYEQLKSSGMLTPQMEEVFTMPDTEYDKISVDPKLKEAQFAALAKLSELGQGGMDVKDLADVERAKQQYRREQQGQQEAIQEGMARRGIASSGMESLLRQQAAQGAADQMLNYEQQTQGEARRRALEAILQQGKMAGDVRGQDYNEQAARAKAQDVINQFNTGTRADVQMRNINRQTTAEAANLTSKQAIDNYNAELAAKNALAENTRTQQGFTNQISKATGAMGVAPAMANVAGAAGEREAGRWQALGEAGGKAAGSYGAYQAGKPTATTSTTSSPAATSAPSSGFGWDSPTMGPEVSKDYEAEQALIAARRRG